MEAGWRQGGEPTAHLTAQAPVHSSVAGELLTGRTAFSGASNAFVDMLAALTQSGAGPTAQKEIARLGQPDEGSAKAQGGMSPASADNGSDGGTAPPVTPQSLLHQSTPANPGHALLAKPTTPAFGAA